MKKSDKILIAVIIIIGVLALGSVVFCSFGNDRKPQDNRTAEEIDSQVNKPDMFLRVDFHCIEDIVYYSEDDMWDVKYNNPDQFDYEWLAWITGRKSWYGNYIRCDIDDILVPQLNDNIMMWKQADEAEKDSIEDRWIIRQHWIPEVSDYLFIMELR